MRARRAVAHAADPTAGDRLATRLPAELFDLRPGIVAAYSPMRDEIDPIPALRKFLNAGWRAALPVVAEKNVPLDFRSWAPGDPLIDGPFGLSQPGPDAERAIPDLFLVPGLAFDAAGCRLGYGGGYYDRTLRTARDRHPVAIGVCYDAQIVDAVPSGPSDMRVGWIVTEDRIFRSGGASEPGGG